MFDDATISKLADEAGIPLHLAREACEWVARQPNVVNPMALARTCCARRRARLDAQSPSTPSAGEQAGRSVSRSQGQDLDSVERADPEVAHRELEKIRAILDGRASA